MALNIKAFVFNMFGINTYVVWDQASRQAMIVDPGMIDADEQQTLTDYIAANSLSVTHMVNTHMHLDHIFGNEFIRRTYGVQVEANKCDEPFGLNREAQARRFGLRGSFPPVGVDRPLNESDTISLGDSEFVVLHIPGHSPGSIVLYNRRYGFLLSGDVLFRGSIGRTDLAMGNHDELVEGIQTKLLTLPPDTVVYPGHGPATTIADELRGNPYV